MKRSKKDKLIIQPLQDLPLGLPGEGPLPPDAPETEHPMKAWAEQVISDADDEGYTILNYGEVLQQIAESTNQSMEFLLENPWAPVRVFEKLGLRSAPDAMLERRKLKEKDDIVLYAADENEAPYIRLRSYKKALLFVKLQTLAYRNLDDEELYLSGKFMEHWIKKPAYRRHLKGMLRWYNRRRRLLDKRTRAAIADFLNADECERMSIDLLSLSAYRQITITPDTIWQLERILQLLGHPPGSFHSLHHRFSCTPNPELLKKWHFPENFVPNRVKLLSEVEDETRKVQTLLSEIFAFYDDYHPEDNSKEKPAAEQLLPTLLEKEEWSLDEITLLTTPMGIASTVVLEQINDLSMTKIGDTVADIEGETVYITTQYKNQLLS